MAAMIPVQLTTQQWEKVLKVYVAAHGEDAISSKMHHAAEGRNPALAHITTEDVMTEMKTDD